MSQSDPTDHALAAIASILDQPEAPREPDQAAIEEQPRIAEPSVAPERVEAEGYSKVGPGPMAAIRFRWTVRRGDNGEFYVDETIGDHGATVASGPLTSQAAIRMVDERESEARQRFEMLKSEMIERRADDNLDRKDSGEA